jgi:hypothetical protein
MIWFTQHRRLNAEASLRGGPIGELTPPEPYLSISCIPGI